jgi:hypothetical protein
VALITLPMRNPDMEGACFALVLIAAFVTVGILIARGAKPAVIVIALLMPFIYLFCLPLGYGKMPDWAEPLSAKFVLGVITAVIAGIIVKEIKKK